MRSATLLALVTLQRIAELGWARANETRLRERGAIEHGRSHYPLIVAMHAAWLASMWLGLLSRNPRVGFAPRKLFWITEAWRAWTLLTLGRRWTTRVLTVPGEAPVTGGPYALTKHPNDAAVTAEIALVPLALGRPRLALLFSVLNAALLAIRKRDEEEAWAKSSRAALTNGSLTGAQL